MIFSDYIWNYLTLLGCKIVFIVTGGYSMFLHDSLLNNNKLKVIVCHHEQGAIYAAIGYAKLNKDIPIVCVTSGCGLTNTITGIADCWQDSVPLLVICGQSNIIETINYNKEYKGRNFSGQDIDVEKLTKTITKYSKQINDPIKSTYYLEKAYYKMFEGRYGASVLSIPLDIQKNINYDLNLKYITPIINKLFTTDDISSIEKIINNSKRPIIIAGNGIKLSNSVTQFQEFIKKYSLPVVTTFLGIDVITNDNPLYIGRIGIMGKRNGNFAVQNADLIICLGSRLPISVVSYQYKLFARNAKILVIDIDKNEHLNKPFTVDYIYEYDLKNFFNINFNITQVFEEWITKCNKWKNMWNNELPPLIYKDSIMNPYHVINEINIYLDDSNYNIISNGGTNFYITWQTINIKKNMNFLTSASQGDLGWELPASIGAYLCNNNKTICFAGDGSFQFNVQELETIKYNKIPILFIIINNNIYSAIEITQRNFFKRFIGIDKESGISFPKFQDIANTYDCTYIKIEELTQIKDLFNHPDLFIKPIICECIVFNQERYPKLHTFTDENDKIVSLPLEDMYPFLSKDIIVNEMIISLTESTIKKFDL